MAVKVGVGVMVFRNDKVLVGVRKGSHCAGLWCFPGGHIEEQDKSLWDCAQREVWEETFITCECFSPDGVREEAFANFKCLEADKHYSTIYLASRFISAPGDPEIIVPREPDKCERWEWVSIERLLELSESSPAQRQWFPTKELRAYAKDLSGRA